MAKNAEKKTLMVITYKPNKNMHMLAERALYKLWFIRKFVVD